MLEEIKGWVKNKWCNTPQVLWLHGPAGKGKSTVAYTIAKWAKDDQALALYISFGLADSTHKFLADGMSQLVEKSDHPAKPTLIIIDGLDRCSSRGDILQYLFSTDIPAHIRILLSCRPLHDISQALPDDSRVKLMSMEDPRTESDIRCFLESELDQFRFTPTDYDVLVHYSNNLFEWARRACQFIKDPNSASPPDERRLAWCRNSDCLDDLYEGILGDTLGDLGDDDGTLPSLRDVIEQLMLARDELSWKCLFALRAAFPSDNNIQGTQDVLSRLGCLFTGTIDKSQPIKPIHRSFLGFLTDPTRNKNYCYYSSKDLRLNGSSIPERMGRTALMNRNMSFACESILKSDADMSEVKQYATKHHTSHCNGVTYAEAECKKAELNFALAEFAGANSQEDELIW